MWVHKATSPVKLEEFPDRLSYISFELVYPFIVGFRAQASPVNYVTSFVVKSLDTVERLFSLHIRACPINRLEIGDGVR